MDGYPPGSLDHNVPLLVTSGLSPTPANELQLPDELKEQATLVRSELEHLETKEAELLAEYLHGIDARRDPCHATGTSTPYKIRIVEGGRSFLLPPRRAKLPDDAEVTQSVPILHSPFSPLSSTSDLYPDGIIDAQWIRKHQELVPSIFLSFYSLTSEPSLSTLQDNKTKVDIGNLRNALLKSGYRTRLAVVLLSQGEGSSPMLLGDGIQERLENIRKGTGLDSKAFFYIPPQDSPSDLKSAMDNVLTSLYNQSVEYYRDLGRHARKKRGRGVAPQPTVPPTSGTSQTLSLPGWYVRYDFKSAVFAEFRDEMDVALRSFEQAYDTLLGQDVLDIIPSWSPRWNEARLVADIIATRCLRCLLWTGQTTTAVRRWQSHRTKIRDLVDRRGRGTSNYGWEAWEARWATIMAKVVEKAEIPSLQPSKLTLFAPPEKAVMLERLQPWEFLHHTGYWHRIAARHQARRRALAEAMPEEDRRAPDDSPASQVASKAYTYDTYLCPDPHEEYPLRGKGVEHSQLIIDSLMEARPEFQARNQLRVVADIALNCAKELLRMEAWDDVVAVLRPLWVDMTFRKEGWWQAVEEVGWALRTAAVRQSLPELVVAIDWELLDSKFSRRSDWHYDLEKSLGGMATDHKVQVKLSDETTSSFISATFAFRNKDGKAGESCEAQLVLTSHAHSGSASVSPERVTIEFEGSLRTVTLTHDESVERRSAEGTKSVLSRVALRETKASGEGEDGFTLTGSANFALSPGQVHVYEMAIPLREPGQAQASCVSLNVCSDAFEIVQTVAFEGATKGDVWFGPAPRQKRTIRPDAHSIEVEPRPPKLEIRIQETPHHFYVNEPITIPLEIFNAEEDSANAKLDVMVLGEPLRIFKVECNGVEQSATANAEGAVLMGVSLGTLSASKAAEAKINIGPVDVQTGYNVAIRVGYHLASDPATPILQTTDFKMTIANAFEANFELMPRLHDDPWPSLFDYEGRQDLLADDPAVIPRGIAQKWCLLTSFACFASEDLVIAGLDANVVGCTGGVVTVVEKRPDLPADGLVVAPQTGSEAQFDIVAQKTSLDDRGPVSMDIALEISWRRASSGPLSPTHTTSLLIPSRYVVLSIEPRVLASISSMDARSGVVHVEVSIENASNHFLTFGVGMDPSDEFAFSGPKQTTLHVLPVSRRKLAYRIVPLVSDCFMRLPLVVRDKYFQKVLRVLPTEGMKIDKDGLLLWIPPRAG